MSDKHFRSLPDRDPPPLWQQTWRVERMIPTSDLGRHVTRPFLCMDDGCGRTTFARIPAMATSSRASWGAPLVVYLVVNKPGGSGSTSSNAAATQCNQCRTSGVRYRASSACSSTGVLSSSYTPFFHLFIPTIVAPFGFGLQVSIYGTLSTLVCLLYPDAMLQKNIKKIENLENPWHHFFFQGMIWRRVPAFTLLTQFNLVFSFLLFFHIQFLFSE